MDKVIVIKVPAIVSESVWKSAQSYRKSHKKSGHHVKSMAVAGNYDVWALWAKLPGPI
jgi:hypothetical protein